MERKFEPTETVCAGKVALFVFWTSLYFQRKRIKEFNTHQKYNNNNTKKNKPPKTKRHHFDQL